jgi:hypothetical protein
MHAQLSDPRQAESAVVPAARPWPSVKQPTVRTDRHGASTPSAMHPWTPRHALAQSRNRWWQVLGSNQRRLRRRFYSLILLSRTYTADLRLCGSRPNAGPPPSAIRPCISASGAVGPTDAHGRQGRSGTRTASRNGTTTVAAKSAEHPGGVPPRSPRARSGRRPPRLLLV